MGRIYNKDSRLESNRFFPYIAWAMVIVFAFFVFQLTLNLQAAANDLELRTTSLEVKANADITKLDFDN